MGAKKFLVFKLQKNYGYILGSLGVVLFFLFITLSQGYGKDTDSKAVTTWLLVGYTVVIDPGHGGADPGTVGFHGTLEKNISLTVAKRLVYFFQQAGARVLLTRKSDQDLSDPGLFDFLAVRSQDLSRRVNLVNKYQAQFLLSVHLNHFPDPAEYGAQVFYQTGSEDGKKLAEAIQKELNNYLIDSGRQALAGDFYLCRETKVPAVIIELGFLSNPEEERKLNDPIYQMKAAWAIYAGVVKYLNLLVKKEPSFAPYLWYLLSFKKEALVPDYTVLKKQINKFIAPKDSFFGIYFRDLNSGQEFGINENVPLIAASTVKLPLVLYINTLVNKGKLSWNDKIAYQEDVDYEEGSGILRYTARNGEFYSVRTLATLAIIISDNIAYRMLVKQVGKENLIDFMKYSGGQTVFPGGKNLTTARDMSVYVQATLDFVKKNPQNGKRLLDDLAHSIYHVGLPGQIPAQIMVAHKEGDIDNVAADAGVVFCARPYILVVLSKGVKDIDQGFRDIAEISKTVYKFQTRFK